MSDMTNAQVALMAASKFTELEGVDSTFILAIAGSYEEWLSDEYARQAQRRQAKEKLAAFVAPPPPDDTP